MTTDNKTASRNKAAYSDNPQNEAAQDSGLLSLFRKLDNNPKAAEAMKQALAKTREELKNNEMD